MRKYLHTDMMNRPMVTYNVEPDVRRHVRQ